jgi:hypothetical protein
LTDAAPPAHDLRVLFGDQVLVTGILQTTLGAGNPGL